MPDLPDEFHRIQLALAVLAEDEGLTALNSLVRDACYGAADEADLQRAERIMGITKGRRTGSRIGPKMACEILAALGRFLEDDERKQT